MKSKLSKMLGWTAGAIASAAAIVLIFEILNNVTFWSDAFKDTFTIDSTCEVGQFDLTPNTALENYSNTPLQSIEQLKFPLRRNAHLNYFISQNKGVKVACDVVIPEGQIHNSRDQWLILGPIDGSLVAWVDQSRVMRVLKETAFPIVPIPQNAKKFKLTLIMSASETGQLSMTSLFPMSIVNSWEKIIKIQKVYSFARSVLPFGFLILFFALSITFVLSYNLGIKYSDIMWAMMGLAIGQLDYLIRWKVGLSSWWNYELQIAVYTCFAIALLHHINRDVKPQVKWLMFLAPTILSLSLFFVSAPIRGMIVSGVKLTSWLQVVIYSFVAASGIFATAPLPHRRKNMQRMGIALAILIAVTLAATNILIEIKGIWLRDVNIIATIAIIASFISVDLVLFHRGYFTEKARRSDEELRRLHEEKEKIRFHTALTFGQTAQELLLPMSIDKTMNQRQIYYRCRPHINMAGDWMDTWVGPDGKTIVLLGDVTGKGPSAAIAMASIMTLLQEARDHKLDLAQTIGLMNPRLHTLFKGSIATTWAGAEISSDGNARFSGGGSPGWFVLSKDSLKSLSCRQPMLGMSGEIIQPQFESIALTKDDRIVSVSDGICGSSRQLKQLIGRLDTLKEKPSLELIELLFLFGDENKISDDQSLVVIEPTSLAS